MEMLLGGDTLIEARKKSNRAGALPYQVGELGTPTSRGTDLIAGSAAITKKL